MKRLFLFLTSIFISSSVAAQLPNGSYEQWKTINNIESPIAWQTNQDSLYLRIEKSMEAIDGDYSPHFPASEAPSAWQDC